MFRLGERNEQRSLYERRVRVCDDDPERLDGAIA